MQQPPYSAPNFELDDIKLSDFRGKWVVLYFYPQDDTPGCTIEACSLRDARDELTALDAEVIGISRDDAASHDKFKEKYNLNFHLLSDPDNKAFNLYCAFV